MCIIIAKPSGIDIPETEIFNNCANSNRDGIGFSYCMPGDTVHIAKGFQNVKKLELALGAAHITKEHHLLIHFRLATHGAKDRGNTHPFPVTDDFEKMRWLNCVCGTAVAHNGVFSGMPQSQKYSDTMKFLGGILGDPAIMNNLESPGIKALIKGYCGHGNKLAFLRPSGISLVGDFELDNGVHYSNRQYESWGRKKHDSSWDKDKDGKSYCYVHKAYDYCEWCYDHKKHDTCAYDQKHKEVQDKKDLAKKWKERFNEGNRYCHIHRDWDKCHDTTPKLLTGDATILPPNTIDLRDECEWCNKKEGVKFNFYADAKLCDDCAGTLASYDADSGCT